VWHGCHFARFNENQNCSTSLCRDLRYWILSESVKKCGLWVEINLRSEVNCVCQWAGLHCSTAFCKRTPGESFMKTDRSCQSLILGHAQLNGQTSVRVRLYCFVQNTWYGPKLSCRDGSSKSRLLTADLLSASGVSKITLAFERRHGHSDVAIREVRQCHCAFLEIASWPYNGYVTWL